MMLHIQIILIVVLCFILTALYLDEKQKNKIKFPTGRLIQLWDGSERRRYVRANTNVRVRYSLPRESNNHIKAIKTKDISIGGICMTVNEKLSPHLKLCMEIETPGFPSPVYAGGEVVWVKDNTEDKNNNGIRYFNIGVEFKEVQPKDRERLFKYIKELNKDGQN